MWTSCTHLTTAVAPCSKHAFTATGTGTITVSLVRSVDVLRLQVRDDGIGMVDAAVDTQRASIGLRLVASLADQLDGSLNLRSAGGLIATVEFPAHAQ